MIRRVAGTMFNEQGYDRVSLRAVARRSEVDPALVHHYFSSKADLYCQAVFGFEWDPVVHLRDALSEGDENVGRRAARIFLEYWDAREDHELFLSSASPDAEPGTRALAEMLAREVFAPIAQHFGFSNAALRGQLAMTSLLGVMVARHRLGMPLLSSISLRQLSNPLGRTLQHYLVEAW